ncbi:hypothetical protein [Fimbriimonas ginsengisoli]|uniref:Uncharacterized protein n=1 Tax=Fimbriimonas ginsengisoli Gsoil 348 TaxID=661478 RepID=A0A068NYN2_FIMGI|nr:hypothetical protein [Fimbriimonas ginsengisoli]AIE87119.1 hypothetical protein OP10G_3751 [Fimbriimonas ginsengisoli Gsoil 348]
MNNLLKERLRERALDAQDWFEIRPDPHWWPIVAIPAVIALAYITVPAGFIPILLLMAVVLTVGLLAFGFLGAVFFTVGRIVGDLVELNGARKVKPSSPLNRPTVNA